jgi:predicted membrane-bound dolichyl-phosphate-mannose-protein mannosyltransferase
MSVPPPWTEYAEHDNPFLYFYFTSKQKEFNLWDIKNKALEREYSTYTSKKDKNYHIPLFRTAEEKAKFETEMKNEAEYLSNQR